MFRGLGKTVSRGWPLFVLAWSILLAVVVWAAPPWENVVLDREFAFLPKGQPSRRGEEAFEKAFPQQYHPSSLVLILRREDGALTDEDRDFVARVLSPGLKQIQQEEGGPARPAQEADSKKPDKQRPIIAAIHTFKEPGAGGLLLGQDGKAMLVIVELASELLEHRNWSTLANVDALIGRFQREGKVPRGLEILQTGSAAIGADVTRRQVDSARATELTTVVVVIVLLLLIYRAPLIALVPLVTVFVAVQLALRFLSFLAEAGLVTLFEGVQTFITVIVYGAGVDYCLFLISRYKEELDAGTVVPLAVPNAIGHTGAAVTASAAAVTAGIGMMIFAQFGHFHNAGVAISSSLFISLLAVLTLTPGLLRFAGGWAFWPRMVRLEAAGEESVRRSPRAESLLRGLGRVASLGLSWKKLAAVLERRPGGIWLGAVALMLPLAVVAVLNTNNLEFDLVKRLPASASSLAGIEALKTHFPAGMTGPVIFLIQKPDVNFREDKGVQLIATLTDRLNRQKHDLGVADIRSLSRPLGTTPAAQDALDELAAELQLKKQETTNQKTPESGYQKVEDFYVGNGKGNVTQLQMILNQDPLTRDSVRRLEHLENAVKSNLPEELKGAEVDILGLTAAIRDLEVVTRSDQWRIQGLVVVCVFLILVILLRQPVVSLYLIVSVLLSYLTTLGATFALFWLLDPNGFSGLDWKVPIFLFTILVAVGEDYNIFLMTRVHEEQAKHGRLEGVLQGLVKTGRIITSCGIIMAGTFSSLLPGTLVDLKQLGFALAFGVLLDTFVVRPILLPAFLVMVESGRFRTVGKLLGLERSDSQTPVGALDSSQDRFARSG
jgi:RND superfamily putative drug exporter